MKLASPWVCVAVMALAGCAGSPYIGDTRPPSPRAAPLPASAPARGTLEYSLDYADATYDAYRAKLEEEYSQRQKLSNGLLTLGTLAVGATIGNAHRDVLITSAMVSGLAYQLGTWNSNADRLGIYLEGMKAMACAKSAVAPLRLSDAARAVIKDAEKETLKALGPATDALADTTQWLNIAGASQTPNSETAQAARTEITEAGAQFTQVAELLKLSAGLVQKADGAGAMLEPRIDEVRRQIDLAMKGTLASLNALPQQIASITQYANLFAQGVKLDTVFQDRVAKISAQLSPRSTAQNANLADKNGARAAAAPLPLEPRDQLAAALGKLRAKRALLNAQAARLSGATERATTQVQTDLAGCNVDGVKLTQAMRLDRAQVVVTAGKAQTSLVGISGGTQPYVATPQDSPTTGFSVLVPAGSSHVMVVADAGTVAGASYSVKVEDATRAASALLTLRVEAAAADEATAADVRTCTGTGWLNKPLVCLVQNQLGVTVTGELKSDTCSSFIAQFPKARGVLDDATRPEVMTKAGLAANAGEADWLAKLSKSELAKCKPGAEPAQTVEGRKGGLVIPAGARNDAERKLSPDDIRLISQRLGMSPPVSELTDELRRAIGNYQKQKGLSDTKGELTPALAKTLLSSK